MITTSSGIIDSHCITGIAVVCLFLTQITYAEVGQLPTIGEPANRAMSPAEERKLGADFFRSLHRQNHILQDPEATRYIQHLGNSLSSALNNNNHNYTFFVVDNSSINAFAVPGGYIGFNTGLIAASRDENELAGVMAHEIAHVNQRHIARRIAELSSKQTPSIAAMLAGFLLTASGNAQEGTALLYGGIAARVQASINFTRENEIEADRIGIRLMHDAGYDPYGMANFFKVIQGQRIGGTEVVNYEFLRTHPLDTNRISEAESRIAYLSPKRHMSSMDYLFVRARIIALSHTAAEQYIQKLEASLSDDVISHYALAQAYETTNNWSTAEQIYKNLLKKHNLIPIQLGLARTLEKQGHVTKAQRLLKPLYTLYPDNYAVTLYYADNLINNHHPAQARDLLKQYLRRYQPATVEVYRLLAQCYDLAGQDIDSKQTLAEYYFLIGNYNAAIGQLRAALRSENLNRINRSIIEKRLREMSNLKKLS